MSLNRIVMMGRMVKDPELRHTQGGTPVCSFTLAVDRDFKDRQTGERKTDFLDVQCWRGTAEFVSRYFAKGRMAAVEGRLQIREWTDKDGNRRRSAEIVAENVYFAGSRREAVAEPGRGTDISYDEAGTNRETWNAYDTAPATEIPELDGDGDLPF